MEKPRKKPKSHLQAIFLKRLDEEMAARGITSANAFSRLAGAPGFSTFNPVFKGRSDPRLETVNKIANVLGVPPWHLFVERADIPSLPPRATVSRFPEVPAIGRRDNASSIAIGDKRKKQG